MECHSIATKRKCFAIYGRIKKLLQPYIGFVNGHEINHPDLIDEKRAKMKILLLNPTQVYPLKRLILS